MNIKIVEDIKSSFQVIIKCKIINEEVFRLRRHIELFDKKLYEYRNDRNDFLVR